MTAPVLMNHTAGSRSPAELHVGAGEEGAAFLQWPPEGCRGVLEVLQAQTINQGRPIIITSRESPSDVCSLAGPLPPSSL